MGAPENAPQISNPRSRRDCHGSSPCRPSRTCQSTSWICLRRRCWQPYKTIGTRKTHSKRTKKDGTEEPLSTPWNGGYTMRRQTVESLWSKNLIPGEFTPRNTRTRSLQFQEFGCQSGGNFNYDSLGSLEQNFHSNSQYNIWSIPLSDPKPTKKAKQVKNSTVISRNFPRTAIGEKRKPLSLEMSFLQICRTKIFKESY